MPMRSVSPRQAKAARAVLDMSVSDVAQRSGMSGSSIRRVEDPAIGPVTLDLKVRLQEFYETAGVEFIADGLKRGVLWRDEA